MENKLNSLIEALDNTDGYDRENALIDLYIYLISQHSFLPKCENTFIFIELSKWRDCSLRDGVESYYYTKNEEELSQLETAMKKYTLQEACKKCIIGIHIHQGNRNFTSLDNWILDNEQAINDFLVELAKGQIHYAKVE